ncbi:MAG: hypothetical protein JXA87_05795 [Thermoleophilia bacterium]|nr:hypothetical protein [Thermoleophilia bacterium]
MRTDSGERGCGPGARRARRSRSRALTLALAVLAATVAVTSFWWFAPGLVDTAQAGNASGAHKVAIFEDVTIGPGETRDYVVVVGGRATILGTVEKTVVVVGGDVTIGRDARVGVGRDPDPDGTAVVVVFGDIEVEPGATVVGGMNDAGWRFGDWLGAVSFSPDFTRWDSRTVGGWVWLAVFLAVVAVIMVAIAPKQVAFVSERVRSHVFSSLGWGALAVFVAVPLITLAVLVLVIFLVGILLLIPWLGIVLPVFWLFGFVAVGAALGRLILGRRGDERGPMMLAAVLGVVILSILWWIPVAGPIILFLLSLVGFGATCASLWGKGRQKNLRQTTAPVGSVSLDPPAAESPRDEGPPPV